MEPAKDSFENFVSTQRIVIPLFQRHYEWGEPLCDQLLNDLYTLALEPDKRHFFGTILYVSENRDMTIIDGQQRIISVSLMLCALRDLLNDGTLVSRTVGLADNINKHLILKTTGKPIVEPIDGDKQPYSELILGKSTGGTASTVYQNYLFFKNHLSHLRDDIDPDALYHAALELTLVSIGLDAKKDDPQGVFDSINSKMQLLEDGDRIRNYLFMSHTENEQKAIYDKYWKAIEKNSCGDLTEFFRKIIAIHSGSVPNDSRMYHVFKKRFSKDVHNYGENYEDFYCKLEQYSKIFYYIKHPEDIPNVTVSRILIHLNYLRSRHHDPFVMRLLWEYEHGDGKLSKKEMEGALDVLRNYMVRFQISCLEDKGKIWDSQKRMLANLYDTVKAYGSGNFVEILKYVLLSKGGRVKYPRDDKVASILGSFAEYEDNRSLCTMVLALIENANNNSEDYIQRVKNKSISVEHIVPQTITPEWKTELGDDTEEVYQAWIHRLGNLTLTSFNSELGNKSYTEKKTMPKIGYDHSGTFLDSIMKKEDHWSLDLIKERNNTLVKAFITNVPELKTSYRPTKSPPEKMALYDDFCNKKIVGYIFDGNESSCTDAYDAYVKILKELFAAYPRGIRSIQIGENTKEPLIATQKVLDSGKIERKSRYAKIDDSGVYVCTDYNDFVKFEILTNIFDTLDLDYDLLTILVKQDPVILEHRSSLDTFA